MVRVWDPLVRIGHWTLVGAIVTAWFTRHGGGSIHEWAGYAVIAVVLLRLVWGMVGAGHARFGRFVRPPAVTLRYAQLVIAGRALDCGHFLPEEKPAEVLRELRRFLARSPA